MKIEIRLEEEKDYRKVEEITRCAFWNLHTPGCDEHYLVHKLRTHSDFMPELDFVAVKDSAVIGSIMFARSCLLDENDKKLDTITFGPVSVHPDYQRQGIGSKLITHAMGVATEMGHSAVVIYGNPVNYVKFGFKGSKSYHISTPEGRFPCSLLALELKPGILDDAHWRFYESDVYELNMDGFETYDASFQKMEKRYHYTQELYSILSNAFREE